MKKLHIVGVGPGAREYILPEALKIIEQSDVLIGGARNLELFSALNKEKLDITNNLEEICRYIKNNIENKSLSVIVTGDPGLYSIMNYLKARLPGVRMDAVPGVSSLQYLCCKQGMNWEDLYITSLHGREQPDFIEIVKANKKVGVFTGGETRPDSVCKELLQAGICSLKVTVGENLTYADERIVSGTPQEVAGQSFKSLSVMVIEHHGVLEAGKVWEFKNSSIPDGMFIRGKVPMTKEEVRALSISRLRLMTDSTVLDIGAGTGSVSIECALRCSKGKIYAVEKNPEALELIRQNALKFGAGNMQIIGGQAPDALKGLPEPDRVFIGGSSGNMEALIAWVSEIGRNVRIVMNAVTPESLYEALRGLEKNEFEDIEVTSVSIARGRLAGGKHLMEALNPVYIISAEKWRK